MIIRGKVLGGLIFVVVFLDGYVSGQRESVCPPQELILPCRCSQRGEEIQIWCSHSDLPRVLGGIKSVSKTILRPVDELILENNFLPSLPGRSFSPLGILRLMLRHNGLERLSSGWLNGLDESLVEIFIVERDLRSVPEDSLNGLKKLEAVTIQSDALKRPPDFSGLRKLRYVNIQSPSLLEFLPNGFRDIINLETVHITGSPKLSRMEGGLFHDLSKLNMINCADNGINWIHLRALVGLPDLKSLILTGNKVSDAGMVGRAVKDLISLESLKLDHNHISVLGEGSFVDLPAMKELYLNDNAITEIHHGAFHRIPNLKVVHLENNYLRRVHPESFLQASGSGVEIVHLQRNDIRRVEELRSLLDALPTLKFLDLSFNKLQEIPFGALRGHGTIEQLFLDHNQIRMIERDAFMAMPGLRELRLKNNSITDLLHTPFWNLPGLKGLDLSYNKIRRLEPSILMGVPSLRRIDLSGNSLALIDPSAFAKTTMLETINMSNNEITQIHPATFRNLDGLFELDVSQNLLQEMMHGLPRAVERVIMHSNRLSQIGPTKSFDLPNLRLLDISSNQIQRLPRSTFKSLGQLRVLNLANNKITAIDEGSLTGLARLEFLNIQDNKILGLHDRSLANLSQLKDLNMQGNRLELLGERLLDNLPELEKLDVSRNNIVEVFPNSFRQARSLQVLDLSSNNMRELPESILGLSELKEIDVSFNNIGVLSPDILNSLRNLEELRASNNKVTDLRQGSFRNLPLLQYLDLSSNELKNLEQGAVKNLPELQELVLADNKLGDIRDRVFEELPNLQAVHLQQNYLRTISPNSFFRSPSIVYLNLSSNQFRFMDHIGLRSVRNLEVLDLSNNGIRKVSSSPLRGLDWLVELKLDDNRICKIQGEPFSSMPRLRVLSMRNNRMSSLPEVSFKTLRGNIAVLDLDGNPLDCSCDMMWLRAWLEAESNNPGPRCRDGTMLRESRISRSECQYDGRNNQVPSLTNEHGDIFFRNNDFDECENEALDDLQNQLPPSPEESEYFYDQFVDFPFNDTHLAITNDSAPISLPPPLTTQKFPVGPSPPPPPQNSFNRNGTTLLNFNSLPQRPPPTSPFTFFGVPLPALSLGNLWGNGSGRDVRNRAGGVGTRGKGRVQIYRPDDPEIQKFLQTPGRYPDAEHRNRHDNGLNVGEIERRPQQVPIPQDDNNLFHRPYFQTPFMKPHVENGGFIPMLPGTGGFTPINDPYLNHSHDDENESTQILPSQNTNKSQWPDDFPDIVPVVTEASSNKKFEYSTPQTSRRDEVHHDEKSAENSNRLDYVTRPSIISSSTTPTTTTTSTTTTTTTTTTVSPKISFHRNHFPESATSSEENIHTTNDYPQIPETLEPFNNPSSTTPMSVKEKPSQHSPPSNIVAYTDQHQHRHPTNNQPELWENQNSPSSLSALVAPGAQQNSFRNGPGRSTITKVATPIPPPAPTAEEYHRVTKHDRFDDERPNISDAVTTTIIENVTPKKKEDMEWYFANYNKTSESVDFEPGLNSFKSSASSSGLSLKLCRNLLFVAGVLVLRI